MVGATKAATSDERDRYRMIKSMGCLACMTRDYPGNPAEVHHVVEGNKRMGNSWSFGLCPWHHRGVIWNRMSVEQMTDLLGPPLEDGSKPFVSHFGSERALIELQDWLIAEYERSPWFENEPPSDVVFDFIDEWRRTTVEDVTCSTNIDIST